MTPSLLLTLLSSLALLKMRILADLGHYLRHGVNDIFAYLQNPKSTRVTPQAKQMTSSKFTCCWTITIFTHFITQVYLQGVTFGENNYARSLASLYLGVADASHGLPAIRDHTLQICDGIPGREETTCQVISTERSFRHQPRSNEFRLISLQRNFTVPFDGGEKILSGKCIATMQYFHNVLVPRPFQNCFPTLTTGVLDPKMLSQRTSRPCPYSRGFLRHPSFQ